MAFEPTSGQLARTGLIDVDQARRLLATPGLGSFADDADGLLVDLALAADPDMALLLLSRLADACDEQQLRRMAATFAAEPDVRRRLIEIIGSSEALGDFLIRHPQEFQALADGEAIAVAPATREVRERMLIAVGADPRAHEPRAGIQRSLTDPEMLDALRIEYRRALLGIAARDLAGLAPMEAVASWLADLADAVLEGALAIARAGLPEGAEPVRLAVLGMGKCGARELNYVSDVDVIYVAEAYEGGDETAALRTATTLATGLMRACNAVTAEGTIWEVDPNLRPEGKQGALVRTLASHVGYYERWAKTWEFQALLKARPCAGDRELGERYVDAIAPFVWSAADHPGFVEDAQAMRRRVEEHIPARIADRELKLGPGGLRDVEFSVQLLQLVHGRSDVMLRSSSTMVALEALATWGYVGREDASTLADAYRFLRTLEHRIQLHRLRRTHTMPEDEESLRRLGRSMGFRSEPVAELTGAWKRHAREVRRIHEKLFYRPLLLAVARLDAGQARLTPQAAEERLHALGYVDPAGALRHLEALTSGVSRRAAIQRTLLPVMLGWFADAPDPDAGLLGFRRVSDALGATPWYLRLLRDESAAAERMARIMASSRYATELLLRAPDSVSVLADDAELTPRSREALMVEALAAAERNEDLANAVAAVRSLRRRELFRIAAARLLTTGQASDESGRALADVAAATIAGALAAIIAQTKADELIRFCVISMGRFGGSELGFGSDADVTFVYDLLPGVDETAANRKALEVAGDLRAQLMAPSSDPQLDIDADLRPEGKSGPLVRTLASYAAYYDRWSAPWESQALIRADVAAGDAELGAEFLAMIDPLRYRSGGIGEDEVREMRRLKARMESERLPRGADPTLHTKLGRGGLSDVEWVVQLLQMQHAAEHPALRTPHTLAALDALAALGLISASDAQELRTAWLLATSVRDAVMLVRGVASDQLPTDLRELAGVGYVLGYPLGDSGRIVDDYRRITRRARAVMERLFYGLTED